MNRDIDNIIAGVRAAFPQVTVSQWQKDNPEDDDGLWFFSLPGDSREIELESSQGQCPFQVERDGMPPSTPAMTAVTIDQAVNMVVEYLDSVKAAATT